MNTILFESRKRIALITLNNPEKRNALNPDLIGELDLALTRSANDTDISAIIIKANGKTFCSGIDLAHLKKLQTNSLEENQADSNLLKNLFHKIYTMKKPVIAQVEGHAIAGGCGLASVCDFIFAVPDAKFGYTEVKIGFVPALVMVFLIRKIGEQRARKLLLGGNLFDAADARMDGLVTKVIEPSLINDEVMEFTEQLISRNSGSAMAMTKEMIPVVQNMNLQEALDYAAKMNAKARGTDDCKKGIAAFLNKKDMAW